MALGFDMPGFTKTSALGPSRLGEIPPELDRRFSDVKGFPALGREVRIGLTVNP